MRILTRYLTKEALGPFIFGVMGFAACQAGFLMISLASQPLMDGETVLRLTALQFPRHLSLSMPMGIVLGTILALGRLSSHSEVIAMRAGGLSGFRLVLPFVLLGLVASFVDLYLAEVVAPGANREYRRVEARAKGQDIKGVLVNETLPPELDRQGRLKRLVFFGRFDLNTLRLQDVYIHEYAEGVQKSSIWADEMNWDGAAWRFKNGEIKFFHPNGSVSRLTITGGRTKYEPLLPKPKDISSAAADPFQMTWREYRSFITERARAGLDTRYYLVELYSRLALPFACLALTMVGAPLGIQTRRAGSAMSFGLAILLIFAYFFLLSLMMILGRAGILPPVLAGWAANVILFGIGVFLLRRRLY